MTNPPESQVRVLWEAVPENPNAIRVNLDAPMWSPPGSFWRVLWNKTPPGPLGWVTVERRGDSLYVGEREVTLHVTKDQKKGGSVRGYVYRQVVEAMETWHMNIMEALVEAEDLGFNLIPVHWRKVDSIIFRHILCFQVGFYSGDSYVPHVPCMYVWWFRWRLGYVEVDQGLFDANWPTVAFVS